VRNLSRAMADAKPASGVYIDWWGVKSWTGLSARFGLSSALGSPRTSALAAASRGTCKAVSQVP
jgi:hypothetical protein